MQGGTAAVEQVFREEYGQLIASLVRRFGDIDIAEEKAASETLVAALEKGPESGVPPNPGGWLTTTAGNRTIDRIRRERQRDAKHQTAFTYHDDTPHEHTGPVENDRLRLLFTCCHPALAPEARIALTLRLLGLQPLGAIEPRAELGSSEARHGWNPYGEFRGEHEWEGAAVDLVEGPDAHRLASGGRSHYPLGIFDRAERQ